MFKGLVISFVFLFSLPGLADEATDAAVRAAQEKVNQADREVDAYKEAKKDANQGRKEARRDMRKASSSSEKNSARERKKDAQAEKKAAKQLKKEARKEKRQAKKELRKAKRADRKTDRKERREARRDRKQEKKQREREERLALMDKVKSKLAHERKPGSSSMSAKCWADSNGREICDLGNGAVPKEHICGSKPGFMNENVRIAQMNAVGCGPVQTAAAPPSEREEFPHDQGVLEEERMPAQELERGSSTARAVE